MRVTRYIAWLAGVFLVSLPAVAQGSGTFTGAAVVDSTNQGLPTNAPVRFSDYYAIDPSNGNVQVRVPFPDPLLKGPGPHFDYSLYFDFQTRLTLANVQNQQTQYSSGPPIWFYTWRLQSSGNWLESTPRVDMSDAQYNDGQGNTCEIQGPFIFQLGGTRVDLGLQATIVNGTPLSQGNYAALSQAIASACPSGSAYSATSGYSLNALDVVVTGSLNASGLGSPILTNGNATIANVRMSDGTVLSFGNRCRNLGAYISWCLSQAEDSNGRLLTVSENGNTETWTNAAGATALQIAYQCFGPNCNFQMPATVTTLDAQGNAQNYNLAWGSQNFASWTPVYPSKANNTCVPQGLCDAYGENPAGNNWRQALSQPQT
jgi:hypothetical protein